MDFEFIHTQDPSGAGGMDDRFDQILLSASLIDGRGFDYIGNPNLTYSTTTWNDTNHSYRCWGNDGTSFNTTLTIMGNTMVGATIAQALVNVATTAGGHLPVFLDLKVPPKVDATGVVNFGQVLLNSTAQEVLSVSNVGDTALWTTNGISALHYSLVASSGFSTPGGNFTANPGAAANNHTITMNTSSAGLKNGTVTINSDDPDTPALVIHYTGEVVQEVRPDSFSLLRGIVLTGGLSDLFVSDDSRLVMRPGVVLSSSEAPIQLVLNGTSPISQPGSLAFKIESSANQVNLNQTISLYNYITGAFEDVDTRSLGTTDSVATITIASNAARFVGSGGAVQAKVSYKAGGPILAYPWQIRVDQAIWTVRP